jgi:hypothetical protein
MQVSATLIAAQQAAREAQSRFQATHVAAANKAPAGFSAALEKTENFSPLPLKQTAPAPQPAPPAAAPQTTRPGALLDIRV